MHNLIILSERNYRQICIQRSPLGQGKNDMFRQMTAYLILVDLNFLFRSAMIRVLLLPEDISLENEKMVVTL